MQKRRVCLLLVVQGCWSRLLLWCTRLSKGMQFVGPGHRLAATHGLMLLNAATNELSSCSPMHWNTGAGMRLSTDIANKHSLPPTCVAPFGPPPNHPCTMLQSGPGQDHRAWPAAALPACTPLGPPFSITRNSIIREKDVMLLQVSARAPGFPGRG